jgi:hypothetical protein
MKKKGKEEEEKARKKKRREMNPLFTPWLDSPLCSDDLGSCNFV